MMIKVKTLKAISMNFSTIAKSPKIKVHLLEPKIMFLLKSSRMKNQLLLAIYGRLESFYMFSSLVKHLSKARLLSTHSRIS